ncbi:trihelix transcription factor GT-3b-like [Argentina anserina]|uniref:trihelix transcription factor GT-3b-like n=1 Tax=Argentina anserina TaxID=57926 RepID=UPI00217630B5|nr:trihelix transcription factor GT-3b-like [Potentilla anserina]
MYGGGGEEDDQSMGFETMRMMVTSPTGQWGPEETRELIAIRGELEKDSSVAKRSKALWEAVSSRMNARGFKRTSEQCKCKWKNLLIRYKGKGTSDPETGRKCPFFEELQEVFTERERNMQRLLLESEAGAARLKKRVKKGRSGRSSDELSEDPDEDEDNNNGNVKKRKVERVEMPRVVNGNASFGSGSGGVPEMLRKFLKQQQRMEIEWREMMGRRAQERHLFEQEWRQRMVKVGRERLMVEKAWREREEQRRVREESRAERRDALMTSILNKLIDQSNF